MLPIPKQQILIALGLTSFHFQVLLITFFGVLLILILSICCRNFGVFKKVQINIEKFNSCNVIYFNHLGAYQNIGNTFNHARIMFEKHFKISKMFGVYYDNPNSVQDRNQCRSTVGLIINPGQTHKIHDFIQQFPSMQVRSLPSCKCLTTRYPYINQLSFLLIVSKVYPKIMSYTEEYGLEHGPMMQIYHFLSQSNKEVEVMVPLESINRFILWQTLQEWKEQSQNRKSL